LVFILHNSDECYDHGEAEQATVKGFHIVGFYNEFLFAFSEVFFQSFLRIGGIFHVFVCYVGHTDNAAKYIYRVEFFNEGTTTGVSLMHLTSSFNKQLKHSRSSANCWKPHYDEVSHLTNEEGDVKYKIEMLRVCD
jgi:hypothetical protein